MEQDFEYYYNRVPGEKPWRNNLIYTSLVNKDRTVFCKWYHNDTEYHQGQNQIVDPELMDEKWNRELHFLSNMEYHNPSMVPRILEVDIPGRKIYLEIDGVDLWQRSLDGACNFDAVLPDWQDQMLDILRAHKERGWYKYSLHPSSYFIVGGKLKSINYFFTYSSNEPSITVDSFLSHVSETRRIELKKHSMAMGIEWARPTSLRDIQLLAFECFSTNYPREFIDRCKELYV